MVGGRWLVSWLEGDHMIGREHVKQWSHRFFCNAHGFILEFNQVQALVETLKPLQRQVSFMSKANSTRPPLCSRERWRAAKLSWGRTIRTPWRRWTTWRCCWRWDHGRSMGWGEWQQWQPWNDLKPWFFRIHRHKQLPTTTMTGDENYQPLSICGKLSGMVYYYYYRVYYPSPVPCGFRSLWFNGTSQRQAWIRLKDDTWMGGCCKLFGKLANQHFEDKWWEFPMDDDGHLWQSFLLGRGDTSAQRNQRAGGSLGMDQTHWTAISFFFNPTNDHTRILTQNLYTYIY